MECNRKATLFLSLILLLSLYIDLLGGYSSFPTLDEN